MYLSAMLRRAGHTTDVFIVSKNEINSAIEWDADVYAFTSSTPTFLEDEKIAAYIKTKTGKTIIFGGPHPTFCSRQTINSEHIDIICIGEGYTAIVELADNPKRTDIKNLWFKTTNGIIQNDIAEIYNINKLPAPDYDIYYSKYPELKYKSTKQVYIVRGCPQSCTFCYNPVLNKIYQGRGKILQHMDINKAVREIKNLQSKYGFKWLQFISDTMNLDTKWFSEFLIEYKKEVNAPYLCNVRLNKVDENLVKLMKETGCDRVDFGIEHGNDDIRNRILKRNMNKRQMIEAGKLFWKYKIRVQTTNIFGLPEETLDKAIETVKLNQAIKPEVAKACILQPFPGTEIYNYAEKNNLLQNMDKKSGTTYQKDFEGRGGFTKIKLKDEKKIIRLSYLFDLFVQRKWLNPLIKIIVSLPLDKYYRKIYNKTFGKLEVKYK